ncbi:MAG: hypothetical protein PVJ49_04130 [Acidobacteriota bacterium]|jgi:hypothetical protein
MLADLFMIFGKGVAEQLTYWAHTYLPGRWRKPTDEVIEETTAEARRYGISSPTIDRRRAYQVARMVVPNRHGDHLADLTPDAYNAFSPTSCAKSHSGKKKIAGPAERKAAYLRHPQTLAYLMTPPELSRLGLGGSAPETVCGVTLGQAAPPASVVAGELREQIAGKGGAAVDRYAEVVVALHSGPAKTEEEPAAA